jgi:hypothetical protein
MKDPGKKRKKKRMTDTALIFISTIHFRLILITSGFKLCIIRG